MRECFVQKVSGKVKELWLVVKRRTYFKNQFFFKILAKLVVTEKTGHVMAISINRPEVRNCVNVETADQLYEAFQEFERDDDAYVAVFYGKGEVMVI